MQLSLFTLLSPGRVAALFFLILSMPAVKGQSPVAITIADMGNGDYKFTTSGLSYQDLVFFRFSDGYHMMSQCPANQTNAFVNRRFQSSGNIAVAAYVAKKGGPVLLTSQVFNINGTGANTPPLVGLSATEQIRLGYTWMPFTDISGSMPLNDMYTSPPMVSSSVQPWFMLPVTFKPARNASHAEINIPAGLTSKGVIFKNYWVEQGQFTIPGGIDIGSITNTPSKVTVNFNQLSKNEFNVYILVTGTPVVDQSYTLAGGIYNSLSSAPVNQSTITVQGRQNPHDPNILVAREETICPGQIGAAPLRYHVEFQNTGFGPADDVRVTVDFKSDVDTPFTSLVSTIVSNITSNYSWLQPQVTVSEITDSWIQVDFYLDYISLPGLYQSPPPNNVMETIGWVNFEMKPTDCLEDLNGVLLTQATVAFSTSTFYETVETNQVSQIVVFNNCPPENELCNKNLGGGGNPNWARSGESPVAASGNSVYYPSPFHERLQMEVPVADANTPLTIQISDITGKIWMQKSVSGETGTLFRQSLDTSTWPLGMYLVHCAQGGQSSVGKILKQ